MANIVYPLFFVEDPQKAGPIESMPGVSRLTLEDCEREIEEITGLGIRSVLLFGVPAGKDTNGERAAAKEAIAARAIEKIRRVTDRVAIYSDVCLCSYTSHGHCGVISGEAIDNDATLVRLSAMAVRHADAGADFVAPSAMMDGQVHAIRQALDDGGHASTGILSYAAKFASSFYGPFRDAADSTPQMGDRRGYQMQPANRREAMAEIAMDIEEGADLIMIKPAMPYLDVVREAASRFGEIPLLAYQVSGEYAMLKSAAANGWLNERQAVMESIVAIRRAGADAIITYFAKDLGRWGLDSHAG
jgi:porphobilinogen synthase